MQEFTFSVDEKITTVRTVLYTIKADNQELALESLKQTIKEVGDWKNGENIVLEGENIILQHSIENMESEENMSITDNKGLATISVYFDDELIFDNKNGFN